VLARDLGAWLRRLRGRPRQIAELDVPMLRMGSDYGGYCVCPTGLDHGSVVYSFGIGEDVSFDLAMIERFGVTVHAFDPTPRSIEWVSRQSLPAEFTLHPWGVASFDGTARFTPPKNPAHVSHRLSEAAEGARGFEAPVKRLGTIMRELGHDRVDVLKLDVEGAEYALLEELWQTPAVGQLLLEFHHHLPGIPLARTEAAIDALMHAGFELFHVSDTAHEFSFLRRGAPARAAAFAGA
jgi:FkbM family methyltransferase